MGVKGSYPMTKRRKEFFMARPKKERVICSAPRHRRFAPIPEEAENEIILQADEYEVLRLHDLEHLTQSEVAAQMLVSRPTVTILLNAAHQKLADALVNGRMLVVEDGNCAVCEIGCACPTEKKETCENKQRCKASCRLALQTENQ